MFIAVYASLLRRFMTFEYGTKREDDASTRGKSVEFVQLLFTATRSDSGELNETPRAAASAH
jgi:hypothetical protein